MAPTQTSSPRRVEFGSALAQRLAAAYMTSDVIEQRRQTLAALALQPDERIIDIGGAPGYLALDMAAVVGSGGSVSVVDNSESMLEAAREICAGKPVVEVRWGDAQALPYADEEFDVAVATQVLEFVPDVDGALREARRVLKPGGRALVLDTDIDSVIWSSSDAALTVKVIGAWERHHTDAHLPRSLLGRLRRSGFIVDSVTVIPIVNTSYDETTLSFHLSRQIAEQAKKSEAVAPEDTQRWLADLEQRGHSANYFFSLNRYVFTAHTD
jgi:arsenite methyltransferase